MKRLIVLLIMVVLVIANPPPTQAHDANTIVKHSSISCAEESVMTPFEATLQIQQFSTHFLACTGNNLPMNFLVTKTALPMGESGTENSNAPTSSAIANYFTYQADVGTPCAINEVSPLILPINVAISNEMTILRINNIRMSSFVNSLDQAATKSTS